MHRNDGSGTHEEQAGTILGVCVGYGGAPTYFLSRPEISPLTLRQVYGVTENAHEQVLSEHILIAGVVYIAVVGKLKRHRPDNGHARPGSFDGSRIDIGQQGIAQPNIVDIHAFLLRRKVLGLHQRVPTVDLHPRKKYPEVQCRHLPGKRIHRHDVAGSIHMPAHTQVQLVEESRLAAPVVAARRCAPVLRSGISRGIVMPVAASRVAAHHQLHLLGQQHLVQVMHFLVAITVVIFPCGMLVDGAGGVHLESVYAIVDEFRQVIHPVLLAAGLPARGRSNLVFFRNAEVVFLAEPQSEPESHAVEASDEEAEVLFLRIGERVPVAFGREELVVPLLLG